MGGGPAGLPLVIEESEISNFGLLTIFALLPEFSSAPARIHCRIVSRLSPGIIADLGGMLGCCLCETRRNSRLLSGSPGLMTSPELPPAIRLVKLLTTSPPLLLSWLWQAKHLSRRIGRTCSS